MKMIIRHSDNGPRLLVEESPKKKEINCIHFHSLEGRSIDQGVWPPIPGGETRSIPGPKSEMENELNGNTKDLWSCVLLLSLHR